VVGRAIDARRREFTTAGDCARRALIDLGCPPVAILPTASREPICPEGFVGSITDFRGYRAAGARRDVTQSIRIDAEPHEPLPRGILGRIAQPEEKEGFQALGSELCWERILFGTKESIYKVGFPDMRQWLGLEDAAVSFDPIRANFRARVLKRATVAGRDLEWLQGRFRAVNGLVLTFLGVAAATEGAA